MALSWLLNLYLSTSDVLGDGNGALRHNLYWTKYEQIKSKKTKGKYYQVIWTVLSQTVMKNSLPQFTTVNRRQTALLMPGCVSRTTRRQQPPSGLFIRPTSPLTRDMDFSFCQVLCTAAKNQQCKEHTLTGEQVGFFPLESPRALLVSTRPKET